MSFGQAAAIAISLIPRPGIDVVGVYTPEGRQVFTGARPIKAVVKEDSKAMDHPIENGTLVTDYRIVLQIEIELSMVLMANVVRDAYQEIRELFYKGTLLTVQTVTGLYTNQFITGLPHEENSDYYGAATLSLKLKQMQFITAQYGTPRKPSDNPTIDRGQQQAAEVKERSSLDGLIFR